MKDRIRLVMESQHMTQQTFAQFIGISPAALSSIFNGRTNATLNTVEAIKSKLPLLNSDWLLFGKGKMYDDASQDDSTATPTVQQPGEQMLDFNDQDTNGTVYSSQHTPVGSVNRAQQVTQRQVVKPEIKYAERPQRHITEIRVYFDDLTYESFVPKK